MQASGFVTVGSYFWFLCARSQRDSFGLCVVFVGRSRSAVFGVSFCIFAFFFVLISLVFALRGLYTFLHYSPRIIFRSTMHFTHVDV